MKPVAAVAAVLALAMPAAPASAAVPEFGTRAGDLACVGLMNLAVGGASASKPSDAKVVAAMTMVLGFYLGRLSMAPPQATKAELSTALASLTLEEKNTLANLCLRGATPRMPVLG